jgi:predicted nucleic acid-binding protein
MEKNRIIVDTDILIKFYRGDIAIKNRIIPIQKNLSISIVTALELLQGVKSVRQFIQMRKTIHAYKLLHLTARISETAWRLTNTYGRVHTIKAGNILIAATALENNLVLYTDNISDYNFIKALKIYKPL